MTLVELALVLIYTSVLLIKSCSTSAEVCTEYGFGDTPDDLFLFFLFFGMAMVALLFFIALVKLYITNYLPKFLLVARAHAVSPSKLLGRVITRRHVPTSSRRVTWRTHPTVCTRVPRSHCTVLLGLQGGRIEVSSRAFIGLGYSSADAAHGCVGVPLPKYKRPTAAAGHTKRNTACRHWQCCRAAYRRSLPAHVVLRAGRP